MAKTLKQIIAEVKSEALSFVDSKRELMQLQAIEKGVPAGVRGVYYAIMGIFGIAALFFLQVVIALLFAMIFASKMWGAYDTVSALAAGFGCLVGLFVLLVLIMLLLRKPIIASLEEKIITSQLDKLEEKEREQAGEERRETATVTMVADVTDVQGETVTHTSPKDPSPVVEVPLFSEQADDRDPDQ